MTKDERFALAALLEEMRVFFHIESLTEAEQRDWWVRNYMEFAGLASEFSRGLPEEDQRRLEEISERTVSSRAYGLRTRAQRLGED